MLRAGLTAPLRVRSVELREVTCSKAQTHSHTFVDFTPIIIAYVSLKTTIRNKSDSTQTFTSFVSTNAMAPPVTDFCCLQLLQDTRIIRDCRKFNFISFIVLVSLIFVLNEDRKIRGVLRVVECDFDDAGETIRDERLTPTRRTKFILFFYKNFLTSQWRKKTATIESLWPDLYCLICSRGLLGG